ncbi:MAG: diphthine--ammonia ligase [Eubacteriaceae bacterium]
MKLIVSYSCGKDSTLALHRVKKDGHTLLGLLVTINPQEKRSWFHGVTPPLLQEISNALNLPLMTCVCHGDDYHLDFENTLKQGKAAGAQGVVFGDIDIEAHRKWCTDRCDAVGLEAIFPLWQENRETLVHEFVALGYTALIKCIDHSLLSREILGKPLDSKALDYFSSQGIDVCGENGEYHTVVVNGPEFLYPVKVCSQGIFDFGYYSVIELALETSAS